MNWIKCSEKMPEKNTEVLVKAEYGITIGYLDDYDLYGKPEKTSWYMQGYRKYEGQNIYLVTHWMPLPEPPKGEVK